MNEIESLRIALEESVKLQSHYAMLLNGYDGGQRITFESAEAWMNRLRETGKIAPVVQQDSASLS